MIPTMRAASALSTGRNLYKFAFSSSFTLYLSCLNLDINTQNIQMDIDGSEPASPSDMIISDTEMDMAILADTEKNSGTGIRAGADEGVDAEINTRAGLGADAGADADAGAGAGSGAGAGAEIDADAEMGSDADTGV